VPFRASSYSRRAVVSIGEPSQRIPVAANRDSASSSSLVSSGCRASATGKCQAASTSSAPGGDQTLHSPCSNSRNGGRSLGRLPLLTSIWCQQATSTRVCRENSRATRNSVELSCCFPNTRDAEVSSTAMVRDFTGCFSSDCAGRRSIHDERCATHDPLRSPSRLVGERSWTQGIAAQDVVPQVGV